MERLTYKSIVSGERHLREGCGGVKAAIDRLAAYEDTGRTPEEVREMFSWSYGPLHKRIGELLQAEDEGRLVVLPCKVGDKLFQLFHGYIEPITVMRVRPYIMTELVSLFPEDFGKTVFLTREDAEKTMKGVIEDG